MSDRTTNIIVGVILNLIGAYIMMWIWNAIIPDVFNGVSKITALQAYGLIIIVNILKYDGIK